MSLQDAWLAALDNLIAAAHHLKEQRGKPGEPAALHEMKEAQNVFDEISGLL
ncbi:hypothetical protein [Brevundimonas subvibrioides]|uniref:hypothetical protein n=1 Tax=Brevundimonas subvibrioides TaxID=74313 RepID=UPI0022B33432|nr:hypothetical protein [Brevundimonas subvibrioides]